MFSSALKSFSSNITSNYSLSPSAVAQSGPWKIYDAKKKSTAKAVSVFVFERKALDPHSGLGRSGGSGLKRVHEEAIERLKKEASSLARLRHPSILELVEPVEDTRNGGLMFATEQVTASLASLLEEKDVQERAGGGAGRASRYVVEDANGGRRRREVEIDELEIQKGLLQIGKALEFLHESAGLVHGNLTPDAILINAKVCLYLPRRTELLLTLTPHSPIGRYQAWGFLVHRTTLLPHPLLPPYHSRKCCITIHGYHALSSWILTIPPLILSSTQVSRPLPICSLWVSSSSLCTTLLTLHLFKQTAARPHTSACSARRPPHPLRTINFSLQDPYQKI